MSEQRLYRGVELLAIYLADGSSFTVGSNAKRIVVTDENGQHAPVPWALVESDNYPDHLVNLALVESVTFAHIAKGESDE